MRNMKIIKDIKLNIDRDEVLRYQEYSKKRLKPPIKIFYRLPKKKLIKDMVFSSHRGFIA
jgi:hypothetical protein